MNFKLALSLLAASSMVQGESNLRGNAADDRNLRVSRNGSYGENLGQCRGATCGMWGDPHMVTCDGLGYDCQGMGLFTIMKNHMYNIQGYFVDVGETEHGLVRGWGLTEGASLANDVIIEMMKVPDAPVIQLGFGDLTTFEGIPVPSEEGCQQWTTFDPVEMKGQRRSVENLQSCRKRCEDTDGCTQFSYWADGGCHLNDEGQTTKPSPRHWSRAVAGRLDSACGLPHDMNPLEDPEEEEKYGIIGRHNNCPLLMHVDGELADLSDFVGTRNGLLLGTEEDDYYVKKVGNQVQVIYTLEDGTKAEIHLNARGDGPGEIWSCHWDLYVCLPAAQKSIFEQGGLGLLGTPNGNTQDDWMDPEGTTIPLSISGPNRHKDAIDYCYDNWCVSQEDSLFAYNDHQTYDTVKCEHKEFTDFNVHNEHCVLSADKIIEACQDEPVLMRYACEVDCCNGGCAEMRDVIGDNLSELGDPSDRDEDIQYSVPQHDECDSQGFLNTGGSVCPDTGESVVKLVNDPAVPIPEGGEIIYGIVPNVEPHDGVAGKSVKFRVNNPFNNLADIYIKHDKSVFTSFMDPTCEPMLETVAGCDTAAVEIEVACHEYPGKTPFALAQIYFSSTAISGTDVTVDKCCKAEETAGAGIVMYTFEIDCECPDTA